jgi:hypothetical protein
MKELMKLVQQYAPELLDLLPEFEEYLVEAVCDTLPILKR